MYVCVRLNKSKTAKPIKLKFSWKLPHVLRQVLVKKNLHTECFFLENKFFHQRDERVQLKVHKHRILGKQNDCICLLICGNVCNK